MQDQAATDGIDTFERLLERAEELTVALQQHPNSAVREDVTELLQTIDQVHRAPVHRLARLLAENGDSALVEKAAADPLVCTLLQLYDVLPLPELISWWEAVDAVRPGLRQRNADLQILDVVNGMGILQLKGAFSGADEPELRGLVERGIADSSAEPRSVRWVERQSPPRPSGFIPLELVKPAKKQTWLDLGTAEDIPIGMMKRFEIRQMNIVAGRAGSGFFAFPDACPGTALPLHPGHISDTALICPWHGCQFDLLTGRENTGTGKELKPLRVRVEKGALELGVWE